MSEESSAPKRGHYWKQKISAYLHDSPNKVLDILGHENSAQSLSKVFGFEPEEQFRKQADFAASAADRIPWPKPGQCKSGYHPAENPFRHPLCGESIRLAEVPQTSLLAEEKAHKTMPALHRGDGDDEERYRLDFLALWRFWQNWASDTDPELGFYPAETRLPDHTIWSHLGITAAMQGCYGGSKADWDAHLRENAAQLPDNPAMLLFSIGPVQEFIAAARTTRDLWSGSYLLSYLMAHALKGIAAEFGPDHVIFPNLKGQPLVDYVLREDWEKSKASEGGSDFWGAFDYGSSRGKEALRTPSLPNRFLALIPEAMTGHPWKDAADFAAHLAENVRDKLSDIADTVESRLQGYRGFDGQRFQRQVESLLEIHWQILPVSGSVNGIRRGAETLPNDEDFRPTKGLEDIVAMVKRMPSGHRDRRYFESGHVGDGEAPGELSQSAAAWSALYALAGWQLDGVKSLRAFAAPNEGEWKKGQENNKDSLTGREEACLRGAGDEDECEKLRKSAFPNAAKGSIRPNEFLGAATLIKRFWYVTYLTGEREFSPGDFSMPNTHAIADHRPFDTKGDFEDAGGEDSAKYYAVLALDGDQMGKWLSGSKCPPMGKLLSEEARDYFERNGNADFLDDHRPLSPSFHLQFSEMLGNFSLHCARRVVEAFDGRLIYAGGDDVLAMLPADTAIDCAAALRAAFRGDKSLPALAKGIVPENGGAGRRSDRETPIFRDAPPGCIRLTDEAARKGKGGNDPLVSDPHRFPVLVPGPATDVSCGIAIGHIKSPLQDLVRAAQAAEKSAKNELGRGACSVSLFKRSGEIQHWGFKWEDPGAKTAPVLPLFKTLMEALRKDVLTNRFPYKLIGLLTPYLNHELSGDESGDAGFAEKAGDIVRIELNHCLKQHNSGDVKGFKEHVRELFDVYWKSLDAPEEDGGRGLSDSPQGKMRDFIGLCSALAWINKQQVSEEEGC